MQGENLKLFLSWSWETREPVFKMNITSPRRSIPGVFRTNEMVEAAPIHYVAAAAELRFNSSGSFYFLHQITYKNKSPWYDVSTRSLNEFSFV